MKTQRALTNGILIPLLSAGTFFAADVSQAQTGSSARDGIVNRVEPKLVPVPTVPVRGAVRVWTTGGEGAVFHPGEDMEVFFRTDRDAYVVVIDIDTRGRARQIYPERAWDDGFVRAGRTMALPGRHAGYRLMVTGPAGIERIVAFASDRPIAEDWEALLADELACLGCAEARDLRPRSGVAWSVAVALETGNARIELASDSSKPRVERGTLDPRLIRVPVESYFLDRDETWFRVGRGARHRW